MGDQHCDHAALLIHVALLLAVVVPQVCGKTREELIPSIPVLPLSWGDALAYLEALDGPEAPPSFRGALNITYRMGPSKDGLKAQLSVHNRFQRSPVWNVIATIPGTLQGSEVQPGGVES